MARSIKCLLFCLIVTGCSGTKPAVKTDVEPAHVIEKPWRHAMATCAVDHEASTVVCPAYEFAKVMKSCVDIWENLGLCKNRLDEAIRLGLVDKAELEARAYDLQARLDNPWRSPWLWGLIAGGVGVVIGAGVVLGINEPTDEEIITGLLESMGVLQHQ